MAQQIAYNVIQGGEDLATPPMTVSPTRCSLALNFECDKNGRMRRADGYERFDGRSVSESVARATIAAVPGAGPVRGVWVYNDVVYAFRNNAANNACVMFKGTAAGWVAVDLGATLAFTSGGTYEPQVGDTITGATSASTAVITRVELVSGTWAGGDAAGTLTIRAQSAAFVGEDLNVGTNLNVCSVAGDSAAVTLVAGGRYEFITYNTMATGSGKKMYGVDGKNKMFQFDGTNFLQIATGYLPDTPVHVWGHKLHLLVAMADGVVMNSGLKKPESFDAGDGAGYIGVSDFIVGFELGADETAIMMGRNSTHALYGASSADWQVVRLSANTGAIEYTLQRFGSPLFMDDRGVTNIQAVQEYGNFKANSIASPVAPFLDAKRALVVGSSVCREKGIYRVYFSDGYALSMTFYRDAATGRNALGFTRLLFPDPVSCACSCELNSGDEAQYFGSTNGMVYKQDYGNSFDGAALNAKLTMHYNNLRLPRNKKRINKVVAEIEAGGGTSISMLVRFMNAYGITTDVDGSLEITGSGGVWDYSKWDQFVWYEGGVNYAHLYVNGSGLGYSLSIRSSTTEDLPYIVNGILTHYLVRGLQR